MAKESGRPAYVVYDRSERSFYAQTEFDPDEDWDCTLVDTVYPPRGK